jgi:uncharacterized protein YyaL (SSP411 family)
MILVFAWPMVAGPLEGADPPGSKPKGKPNRLAREVSPYLLQHAHNPVDWRPWGPDAFAEARKAGKFVFLSIGYSSCHWCHVMERESFSNPAIAEILNKHFICIKVDREERPDVDEVYMSAIQVVGESGGWPLSMFLTDEGKPIFGGTYWPPEDRKIQGMTVPGFKSVLNRVLELQEKDRAGLLKQADRVAELTTEALERNNRAIPVIKLDRELVKEAADAFTIDPEHGGFGTPARGYGGAKFPRASALSFLLRESRRQKNEKLSALVALTLDRMAAGGIYDHLGGGFHRYSTERTWTVPHFEKMLYDNAQLIELYADAFQSSPKPEYRRIITETLEFVSREMTSPDGVFYSALDADSNEKEGEFYVWTTKELDEVLGPGADTALFKEVYGLDRVNFEEKYHILRLPKPLSDLAKSHKLTEDELIAKVTPLKRKLFVVRAKRERPFLDTKVLTGWNGQMIAAFARAGAVLKEPGHIQAAERAATFLLANLRTKDGRLLRMYAAQPGQKPEARGTAFLEDYAFLLNGLLTLHDATGNAKWLDEAKSIADSMMKWHGDAERGGFYMTASDSERLFARGKDYYDGAQPSGNGIAARSLIRLWSKTKDERYLLAAEKTVKLFAGILRTQPTAVPLTADALDRILELARP